jgi:hypothetical protein
MCHYIDQVNIHTFGFYLFMKHKKYSRTKLANYISTTLVTLFKLY